jgi:hypothetical protein
LLVLKILARRPGLHGYAIEASLWSLLLQRGSWVEPRRSIRRNAGGDGGDAHEKQ